ncbi:MAG TPA: gamma carbonic anhydrase family protein [Gammaproteobacteria bacterium]|jgi:carbonic anhydrase/acetyltransferase-like protein (isoleucine patch superfamily)|nr:gamma carbonic anhydrase family protein [Gammaproteobacteria bacterium]
MIRSFRGVTPRIGENSYIDESAVVIGDVVMGENCSVWPLTVIRADINKVRIGNYTNIQDGSVLHVTHKGPFSPDGAELHIGNQVTVGHKVLLHGCRIGNQCLIGMGSIVTDNAVIEDRVMIGSGSLVPPNKVLASGYLYLGNPVVQKRPLSEREIEFLSYVAEHYVLMKESY